MGGEPGADKRQEWHLCIAAVLCTMFVGRAWELLAAVRL